MPAFAVPDACAHCGTPPVIEAGVSVNGTYLIDLVNEAAHFRCYTCRSVYG